MKKSWQDYGREWLDTLVVALSVAMAFRAYFYEPFKIPTGSMQTTLWGNHSEYGVKPGAWDKPGLSILKWMVTGEEVVEYKADMGGHPSFRQRNDGKADIRIGLKGKPFTLPVDACRQIENRFYKPGETVWKGAITTGDFIFVNRWKWNFFQPQDNDVMIFSTTGIKDLVQGTHYIKRMKARPGETYKLEHPINADPRYKEAPTEVTMGEDEFFACGDNFNNSYDSRYWGPVPRANLRGEGSFVFWPISGWRIIR